MKTSKVLELAKAGLARNYREGQYEAGKSEYICYAVNDAHNRGKITIDDRIRVKNIIAERLAPHVSLEDWLEEKHGIAMVWKNHTQRDLADFCDKLQQTRHAWVDAMIAEFKAKGG
jgi:hypothetical protein